MSAILSSGLFALTVIGIAFLAVFDVVPQQVAEYSVIAVPALASATIVTKRRACCFGAHL